MTLLSIFIAVAVMPSCYCNRHITGSEKSLEENIPQNKQSNGNVNLSSSLAVVPALLPDIELISFIDTKSSAVFMEYDDYMSLKDRITLHDVENRLSEEQGKTKNFQFYSVLDLNNFEEPHGETIETLIEEGKSAGFNKYGTSYDVNYCIQANYWLKNHENLGPTWDFVYVIVEYKHIILSCGPEVALTCTQRAIERCQRKFARYQPKLEVYFQLDNDLASNYPDAMLRLAKENNVTLLSYTGAINQLAGSGDNNSTIEWQRGSSMTNSVTYWRLVREINTSTEDDEYNDEYDNRRTEESTCLFTDVRAVNISSMNYDKSFSGEHFGVIFDTINLESFEFLALDSNELRPFIQLVATKFSKIFVSDVRQNELSLNFTEYYIPEAVARYNMRNDISKRQNCSDCQPALQVYMEVIPEEGSDMLKQLTSNEPTAMALAEAVANAANELYNGTVPYILLRFHYTDRPCDFNFLLAQLRESTRMRQLECKLSRESSFCVGVSLLINDCIDFNLRVKQLVQQIPFVVFETYIFTHRDSKRMDLNTFSGELRLCLAQVRKIAPRIAVSFRVSHKFVNDRAGENSHSWVWLWTDLHRWATKENVIIFVDSAFEVRPEYGVHRGWWSFIKDKPCYLSTDQYTFLENIASPNKSTGNKGEIHHSNITNTSTILAVSMITIEQQDENGLPVLFNSTHFGVVLRVSMLPLIKDIQESADERLNSILKVVRTRFSHIMMTPVDEYIKHFQSPKLYIPFTAAQLNSDLYSGDSHKNEKDLLKSTTKPLKISVPFTIKSEDTTRQTAFNIVQQLAMEANAIFPGTVENVLLDATKLSTGKFKTHLEHTVNFELENQKKLSSRELSYTFGIVIRWSWCENEILVDLTEHIVPHVKIIVITMLVSCEYLEARVTTTTESIRECKQRMEKAFTSVAVKFVIYFTPDERSDILADLVNFWIKINDFAVTNNVSVFMSEAFDQIDDDEKRGWWRIVQGELQEKYQIVHKSTTVSPNVTNSKESSKGSVAIIISSTVFALIAVASVVAVTIVIFFRRNAVFALLRLSEKEILEFFEGRKIGKTLDGKMDDDTERTDCTDMIESYAYDNSLELEAHNFTLDDDSKLGSGEYGEVCLGQITLQGRQVAVAVKKVKRVRENAEGLTSLRSILMEIKVLSYIGKHDNIVVLLGAHTSNVREGEVYAFLELCSLGSLQKCLKKLRCPEEHPVDDMYTCLVKSEYDTNPLAKWSLDIVTGMEFLASKRIVHADLATRNVLLDKYNKAKICDFGLSRRMMNYQSYHKTHQQPLPWKWMSPESLRGNIFNEKSDVWAFGVTLWEMYTLGDNPYAGLSWNVQFATNLENGLRLPPPKPLDIPLSGSKSMYPIMELCWTTDPKMRPNFKQLSDMLVV